jgi:tetratricopeptide (TPR) repeat protein
MIALSRCYREAGDLSRAIEVGETAMFRFRESGLDRLDESVQLLLTVAAAYHERGDQTYAVTLCEKAIRQADEAATPAVRAAAYWNASLMESERNRHDVAIALAERALALLGEGRDARNLARLRAQLGLLLLRSPESDVREAERHLKKARRELTASAGSVIDVARVDINLARARLERDDPEGAEELARSGLAAAADAAPLLAAEAHIMLGRAAGSRGDREAMREEFVTATRLLTGVGADRAAGQTWYELGDLFDQIGDDTSARDAYRSAAASTGLRARSTRQPVLARA